MNSEWAIVEYVLADPSQLEEVYELGLSPGMFAQGTARNVFNLIANSWHKYAQRPTVTTLSAAGYSHFGDAKLSQTLEASVRHVVHQYWLRTVIARLGEVHGG